jgi:hypothetical protein
MGQSQLGNDKDYQVLECQYWQLYLNRLGSALRNDGQVIVKRLGCVKMDGK